MGLESKPSVVLFDFDGVVCDSVNVKTQAFDALYHDQSTAFRELVRDYHLKHGGISRYEKIRYYEQLLIGTAPTEAEVDAKAADFTRIVVDQVVASPYLPGAIEALECLHDVARCYVVSGTPQGELRDIVSRRHLSSLFLGVFGSPRKKADIIRSILDAENVASWDAVMIGDAMTDYDAANDTGVAFIGVVQSSDPNPFPDGTTTIPDLLTLPALLGYH